MNQLAGLITEGQAKKMMEILNEDSPVEAKLIKKGTKFKNNSNGRYTFIGGGNCNIISGATATFQSGVVIVGGVGNNTSGGTWSAANCIFTV
jgi:hypothetical protein